MGCGASAVRARPADDRRMSPIDLRLPPEPAAPLADPLPIRAKEEKPLADAKPFDEKPFADEKPSTPSTETSDGARSPASPSSPGDGGVRSGSKQLGESKQTLGEELDAKMVGAIARRASVATGADIAKDQQKIEAALRETSEAVVRRKTGRASVSSMRGSLQTLVVRKTSLPEDDDARKTVLDREPERRWSFSVCLTRENTAVARNEANRVHLVQSVLKELHDIALLDLDAHKEERKLPVEDARSKEVAEQLRRNSTVAANDLATHIALRRLSDGLVCEDLDVEPLSARSRLSGAPERTLFIFDWDDTLFPTSEVQDLGLRLDEPFTSPALEEHAAKVIDLLREASKVGTVAIVTASWHPWVMDSAARFLKGVKECLEELQVQIFYGPSYRCLEADHSARFPRAYSDKRVLQQQFGELLVQQKVKGMRHALRTGQYTQVISIGDGDVEMSAARDVSFTHDVLIKTAKLMDGPSLKQLSTEVTTLTTGGLAVLADPGSAVHFDVNVKGDGDAASMSASEPGSPKSHHSNVWSIST